MLQSQRSDKGHIQQANKTPFPSNIRESRRQRVAHASVRLIGQYDLAKPVQTLDEGMVFGAQNDPYGFKRLGVGSCRGFGNGVITQQRQPFVTAEAAAKTSS